MLSKSAMVAAKGHEKGMKVFHAPISFKEDASDNPNKNLGILAGCNNDKLFTEGTWNADFCDAMCARGYSAQPGFGQADGAPTRSWQEARGG